MPCLPSLNRATDICTNFVIFRILYFIKIFDVSVLILVKIRAKVTDILLEYVWLWCMRFTHWGRRKSWIYHCVQSFIFCMLLFNFCLLYSYFNVSVFFLLCMFRSVYSVSLCCSLYCLCVNVYCTTATGWLPNCS